MRIDRRAPARGVHHVALLSSDVERTVRFYQDLLEFPLTELFENRDYQGRRTSSSTSATATRSPSSTFPASTSAPTPRCSAGCTTSRSRSSPSAGSTSRPSSTPPASHYAAHRRIVDVLPGPDGDRLELITDPLGEMYGHDGRLSGAEPIGPHPGAHVDSFDPSARSSTDRASDYGSEGWGFESSRGAPVCN